MNDKPDTIVSRRLALKSTALFALGSMLPKSFAAQQAAASTAPAKDPPLFTISLAEWSLHKKLYAKELDNLDFPKVAKNDFGIDAVEYVNSFFKDKAKDSAYLTDLKKRCADHGVTSVLIMCDGEGALGDADKAKRAQAVDNHKKWVDAAKFLGCHSIRVNAQSAGTFEEQQKLAAEGLRALCEYADPHGLNVIVENHGGLSSNGSWLAGVMKLTAHPRVGTLPDFGNFNISSTEKYDRYLGTKELMPFAKGVSAKSHDFDENGNEKHTDYKRMLAIVLAHGYHGRIGIEYEGGTTPEYEGVRATKKLLEKLREELAKPGAIDAALTPADKPERISQDKK